MTYALISNGIVDRVIVCDADFARQFEADYLVVATGATGASAGWLYDPDTGFAPPAPPEPEPNPLPPSKDDYALAVQKVLDDRARERNYADIAGAVTYLTSTVQQWSAEATALRDWRDETWVYVFDLLAQFENGSIPQPSIQEVVAGIPEFYWPNT